MRNSPFDRSPQNDTGANKNLINDTWRKDERSQRKSTPHYALHLSTCFPDTWSPPVPFYSVTQCKYSLPSCSSAFGLVCRSVFLTLQAHRKQRGCQEPQHLPHSATSADPPTCQSKLNSTATAVSSRKRSRSVQEPHLICAATNNELHIQHLL